MGHSVTLVNGQERKREAAAHTGKSGTMERRRHPAHREGGTEGGGAEAMRRRWRMTITQVENQTRQTGDHIETENAQNPEMMWRSRSCFGQELQI